jgi:hypothetical protein
MYQSINYMNISKQKEHRTLLVTDHTKTGMGSARRDEPFAEKVHPIDLLVGQI